MERERRKEEGARRRQRDKIIGRYRMERDTEREYRRREVWSMDRGKLIRMRKGTKQVRRIGEGKGMAKKRKWEKERLEGERKGKRDLG